MSSPRSVRFDEAVLARLDRYVREHPGSSSSSVANMFVDESLRTYEHPGVIFRSGPAGRRAALNGGPDVWEVIGALHAVRAESPELEGEELAAELTEVTGLGREQIATALRYYATYSGEIDQLIRATHEAAEREERLRQAEQSLLKRRSA
ncbi:hypothetical protein KBX37_01435 [Micromonospora sp. U56]|uniref:hypothetical protein n=1 Tax=Micromonospora sp. U56 TaxID=2824900 RepID=UPI001B39421A|nr:hypothetical protein [Micromonospora sp. U56]MBQ0891772.1 hypothetical protein [Micromonospora sp. U56]